MTLPIPLTVRLTTSLSDRHVKHELADLSFRSVISPEAGGFASASMSLNRPLRFQPDELAYYSQVVVYDERNGQVHFDGRLEDPGRQASSGGEVWDLAAVGPTAHAQDRVVSRIYIDRSLEQWDVGHHSARYLDVSETTDLSDNPVIGINCNQGSTWVVGEAGCSLYRRLVDSEQVLGRLALGFDCGSTTAGNEVQCVVSDTPTTASSVVESATYTTAGGTIIAVITSDFTGSRQGVHIHAQRVSGGDIFFGAGSNGWLVVIPYVRPILVDTSGTNILTGYNENSVLAHQVVADLLGGLLDQYDGPNSTIATNTYPIEQLAFPDGATPAQMLAALVGFHPDHYWAAWERTSNDLHRFEWRAWPTTIRYEADIVDGFDAPGSAVDLYNVVAVHWLDGIKRPRVTRRTQTVTTLDDAGLTRDGFIDLGPSTETDAIQAGDEFLADHAIPHAGARLSVARPIIDYDRGVMAQPWELRPGHLIRVRGIQAKRDALNATSRDGESIFKVVAVDYSASSAAATLELDSQPVTLSHLIARGAAPKRA